MRPPTCAIAFVGALVSACGDNHAASYLIDRLQATPGVTVVEHDTDTAGYRYFTLQVTQPVDHADPAGPTFQQQVSLLHRDVARPVVVLTTGYDDYYRDAQSELAGLLDANQVSIEHRFFGRSRPEPADWTKLTIEQMASDQHAIIELLRTLYADVPYVSTGASKGGMTATYHRRFFPDDVDVTVPYVAPMSTAAPDDRYTDFVAALGTADCRQALRTVAVELLANRRAAIEALAAAQRGHSYTRISLGAAVEASVASLEWLFWQYSGITRCAAIPPTVASDQQLFRFLDSVAPISDSDDDSVARFEAYYHQAYSQLGYPDGNAFYLDDLLIYSDADYDGALPTPEVPVFDGGAAMADISSFIQTAGERLLFIYGEWDPWTAGAYSLGDAADSFVLVQPEGTHGSRIAGLAPADQALAYERLATWTGVTLADATHRRARPTPDPRPPAFLVRRGAR